MKLSIDLSGLTECARRMGEFTPDFSIEVESNGTGFSIDVALSTPEGVEIDLEELESDQGLLGYRGRQVLLFIPDHGPSAESVLAGQAEGRKFHVADCSTLEKMRSENRFARYRATHNVSGDFEIYGTSGFTNQPVNGITRLTVCKNCLSMLNYKGYRTGSQKKTIFGDFDIAEFLSSYSTLFRIMPEREAMVEMGGYDDGWEDVSKNYRESKSWQCEECKVSLLQNKRLLHTHHINGVKRDNKLSNLKALCLDCHRKQPKHDYMRVTHSDMQTIVRLRREQSLLNKSNWSDAFRMADKSVEGILFHYQKSGQQCPYVGYELTNEKNEVVGELELAWPAFKTGIAINHEIIEKANKLGWKVRSVGEEIRLMSNTKTWS